MMIIEVLREILGFLSINSKMTTNKNQYTLKGVCDLKQGWIIAGVARGIVSIFITRIIPHKDKFEARDKEKEFISKMRATHSDSPEKYTKETMKYQFLRKKICDAEHSSAPVAPPTILATIANCKLSILSTKWKK